VKYDLISERKGPEVKVSGPGDVYPLLKRYSRSRQENFFVVTLSAGHSVLRVRLVTRGLLGRVLIAPREVFYPAIRENSHAILLAHNHPSGCLAPSREDLEATKRLISAGQILGIEVLDHILFSWSGFVSFKESGVMP
jgi:DNA repair protein RadC